MTYNQLIDIANQFNALQNDVDRWKFILERKDLFILHLGDESAYPVFSSKATNGLTDNQIDSIPDLDFDDYFYSSDGVLSLFEAIGIDAEII